MKKKMVSAIIVAMILSLAACGKKTDAPEEGARPADTEETVQEETESESAEAEETEEEEFIDLNKEVIFSDEYLAREARKKASSVTVGGLQEITDLDLNYDKITVPEELAYFTNLQSLEMSARNSGDISWLSYFPDLKYLELDYNHIDNIEELGNCVNLFSLKVIGYNITDISFLENLTSLEEFSIETDALQDFSKISSLTNLSALNISAKAAESLNIDFSGLTNLRNMYIGGGFTDLTSLDSLNVYDEPTYTDNSGYWAEGYKGVRPYGDFAPLTENYRDNYSEDKRPENEYFKYINLYAINLGALTGESLETIAKINYKYLKALDFHIDRNYELVALIPNHKEYIEIWNNLVATNGDPLLKNEAVAVTPLPDLEDFNNPKVYLDGRYIGLYCPLEDMVTGYTTKDGTDAWEYVNSVYIDARTKEKIGLYSGSDCLFSIKFENTDVSFAKPISECEIVEIWIWRNTDIELKLPQGNETKEYVSWDYPHRSFTDIYEDCYTNGGNGDFDIRCYYIFCNDKCDIIEITISENVLKSISLYKEEDLERVESQKSRLTK